MRVVEGFIEKLKTLPKREKALTKNEALEVMRGHLRKARHDGYTLGELVELLKEMGIAVSIKTLRGALSEAGRKVLARKQMADRKGGSGPAMRNGERPAPAGSRNQSETEVGHTKGTATASPRSQEETADGHVQGTATASPRSPSGTDVGHVEGTAMAGPRNALVAAAGEVNVADEGKGRRSRRLGFVIRPDRENL
jgi:hypothetical protein